MVETINSTASSASNKAANEIVKDTELGSAAPRGRDRTSTVGTVVGTRVVAHRQDVLIAGAGWGARVTIGRKRDGRACWHCEDAAERGEHLSAELG